MRHHLAAWASRRLLGRPVSRGVLLRVAALRGRTLRGSMLHTLRRPAIAGPVAFAVLGAGGLVTWQASTQALDALAVTGSAVPIHGAPTRIALSSYSQTRIGYVIPDPDGAKMGNLDYFWDEQAEARGNRTAFVSHRPRHEGQPERDGEIWYMAKGVGEPDDRPPDSIPLTDDNAPDAEPALSPDGKWVAYASMQDSNWDIWVVRVDGSNAHRVTTGPADDRWPTWSPDSTKLAFSSNRDDPAGEIYSVPLTGGAPTRLTNDPGGDSEPAWAPTGNRIAFTTTRFQAAGDIVTMPAGGGAVTSVVAGREAAWSPDGGEIAYAAFADDPNGDVHAVYMNYGVTRVISAVRNRTERHPTWHATRGVMFTVDGAADRYKSLDHDVWSVNSDSTGAMNVTNSFPNSQHQPTFSPDGKKLAYLEASITKGHSIVVADADGANPRTLVTAPNWETHYDDPAWSPDGESIAFSIATGYQYSSYELRSEIVVMSAETGADGTTGVGLTHVPCRFAGPKPGDGVCYDHEPAWSPDGKRLAFTRGYHLVTNEFARSMFSTLYVADAGNAGPFDHQIDVGTAIDRDSRGFSGVTDQGPDWMPAEASAPDTWRIVFARQGRRIITTSPSASDPKPKEILNSGDLLQEGLRDPAYSPDGAAIALAANSDQGAEHDIFTMASGGGAITKVFGGWGRDDHPVYQPAANLTTTIVAAPPGIRLNQASVATVTVSNSGPSTASNASLALTVPAGLRVDRLTPSVGTCDVATLKCSLGTLALGAKVTVKVDLTGAATGGHLVTATATSDRFEYDPSDNAESTTITVDSADISVKVSATPVPGYVGGAPIVVTYLVTNEGTSAAAGVQFVATLPGVLPMVGAPAVTLVPSGPPPPACPTPTAGCALGTLVPGQVVTITVAVAPNAAVNTSAVGAVTGVRLTGDPSDDTASAPLVVLAPQIKVYPKNGQPNFLPVITGKDFPPGTQIRLAWSRGVQTNRPFTVAADGTFSVPLMVFPTDHSYGLRQVIASPWTGAQFGRVQAPYVLDPGRNTPDDFVVRR